jgi:hypothetical protein
MSYIRCLSNPERLYIWHDVSGPVKISEGKQPLRSIPVKAFHGVLRNWWRNRYRGDKVYEGARLVLDHKTWRWLLYYETWAKPVRLWETTLYYLAHDVVLFEARMKREKKLKDKQRAERAAQRAAARDAKTAEEDKLRWARHKKSCPLCKQGFSHTAVIAGENSLPSDKKSRYTSGLK